MIAERLRNFFGKKAVRNPEIETVFRAFSPGTGSFGAPWRDDPHAQVNHCRHWVYVAVRAIASRVAGATLRFVNEETREEIGPSHPLRRLMREVNPFETSVGLWMNTMMFLELTGNAYWYAPRNAFGQICELWLLPSPHMRVIPDEHEFIRGYLFRMGGVEEVFSKDEIIHLKYPNPVSPYYGSSPLQAAAESVDAHMAMKEAERRSFENGAFPGMAIQTDEALSPEVRKRLETMFKEGFSGPNRAGRTLILEQGLKIKPFTYSPREMDFLESSRITRDEILAVFGVPAAVAGISEDVNRASAEAMLYTFAENTILPKLRLIEAQLTQDLCTTFDDQIVAKFDSPVPNVRAEDRADMIARISNKVTTPQEERVRLGFALPKNPAGMQPVTKTV